MPMRQLKDDIHSYYRIRMRTKTMENTIGFNLSLAQPETKGVGARNHLDVSAELAQLELNSTVHHLHS